MKPRIDHYSRNTVGRDLVVGDVHGCFSKLDVALRRIGFNDNDRLFMLGDLIDRGPESHLVLDFFKRHPNAVSIMGNHEDSLVRVIDKEQDPITHLHSYGGMWITRLGIDHDLPIEILDEFAAFFRKLPIAIELKTSRGLVAMVHACCPYREWVSFRMDASEGQLHKRTVLSSREFAERDEPQHVDDVLAVLVGHHSFGTGRFEVKGNVHYLDTGAWEKAGAIDREFLILNAETLRPEEGSECEPSGSKLWSD